MVVAAAAEGGGKKKRDVTHVPSDVESISHDHLPESEITARPAVSREPGIGLGSRVEMGKYPETQSGEETGGRWGEWGAEGVKRMKMREKGRKGDK